MCRDLFSFQPLMKHTVHVSVEEACSQRSEVTCQITIQMDFSRKSELSKRVK